MIAFGRNVVPDFHVNAFVEPFPAFMNQVLLEQRKCGSFLPKPKTAKGMIKIISITKTEAEYIRINSPAAKQPYIVILNKQHKGKNKKRYVEETKRVRNLLADFKENNKFERTIY